MEIAQNTTLFNPYLIRSLGPFEHIFCFDHKVNFTLPLNIVNILHSTNVPFTVIDGSNIRPILNHRNVGLGC